MSGFLKMFSSSGSAGANGRDSGANGEKSQTQSGGDSKGDKPAANGEATSSTAAGAADGAGTPDENPSAEDAITFWATATIGSKVVVHLRDGRIFEGILEANDLDGSTQGGKGALTLAGAREQNIA